jgi:ATP-dependent Clp protease ATP-binding subunit ClpA
MNGYNFTERVRRVLALAREEAGKLHHEYVGTEHILLGLIGDDEGVAVAVLSNFNVDRSALRSRVEAIVKRGNNPHPTGPDLPYTSRAKRVLELAMGEARTMNHSYVGTEHLLLGLLAEERGIAAQLLVDGGITLDQARAETLRLLGTEMEPEKVGQLTALPLVRLTEVARRVLAGARDEAERVGHPVIEPEHIFWALTQERDGTVAVIIERLVTDRDALERAIKDMLAVVPTLRVADAVDLPYSPRARMVIALAQQEARENRDGRVRSHHLLLGVLRERTASHLPAIDAIGLALKSVRIEQDRLLG